METLKRKRRTKKDIEESINEAAIQLIEEKGFQGITVTAIMQKAKIEPIVFYNRYSDLNSFMDKFVKKYDYWFSDIAKNIKNIEDIKKQYISILSNLFDSLQENDMMQQLLRWELSDDNDITRRTAGLREFYTLPLVEKYKKIFENSSVEIDTVSSLIIGGIYYLILHCKMAKFAGIDISSEEGKQKIHKAINFLGDLFFSKISLASEVITIAKNMKEKGICSTMIAECTGLNMDVIEKL